MNPTCGALEVDTSPLPDKRIRDLRGQTFGLLTAVEYAGRNKNRGSEWWCVCSGPDCGSRRAKVRGTSLTQGQTTSCGCKQKTDLTGRRFGKLVVIEQAEHAGDRIQWRCVCDCGTESVVRASSLTRGKTKSCGCGARQKIDLAGRTFGDLAVVEEASRGGNGSAIWLCRCSCGNEVVFRGSDLREWRTSCGCKTRKARDLSGQRFGRLLAVERVEKLWLCKCDCGAETRVESNALVSGRTRSCGCIHRERARSRLGSAERRRLVRGARVDDRI